MTDLGNPFGATAGSVVAINDSGQITGTYQNAQGAKRTFLYSSGQFTDIGTLGGVNVVPYAINNQGIVVGRSELGNFAAVDLSQSHAYVYTDGKMMDLDVGSTVRYSTPEAINNQGQIVGAWQHYATVDDFAVLYMNGTAIDLNTRIPTSSAWILQHATGIDDKGQIVGIGLYNGQQHGFLLTPR